MAAMSIGCRDAVRCLSLCVMNLDEYLPPELRGATITPIAAGMSGAAVYRVGDRHVLKIGAKNLDVLRAAAQAGVAPPVIHLDTARGAVVSAFVADRGFAPFIMNPATRDAALDLLGATLAKVHALPLPPGAQPIDPRAVLPTLALPDRPALAAEVTARVLAETPPPADRAPVLSHNDVNPSNLVYDGERILLLDWDVAGANDPLYDLATIALFLRLDDAACARLLAAHDGAPVTTLPPRLPYLRRLVGALIGNMMLVLARQRGHTGGGDALTLGEYFGKMRAGQVSPATPAGQWQFGLALLHETAER
jgi:hypothetical protein